MLRAIIGTTVVVAAVSLGAPSASAADNAPTYNQGVGQILNARCAGCHRPNQVAPMPLLSYQDARPWAKAIKARVTSREMPPWFADPQFGKFANDRSLSDDEISTHRRVGRRGGAEGSGPPPKPAAVLRGGLESPVRTRSGFRDRVPDRRGRFLPRARCRTSTSIHRCRSTMHGWSRPRRCCPATTPRRITSRPTVVNMPPGMKLGTGPAWPGGPIVDYVPVRDPRRGRHRRQHRRCPAVNRRTMTTAAAGFGAYIPGAGARVSRPGQARDSAAISSSYIGWNLHYQATGEPETARPAIGVWWGTASAVPR